MKLVSRIFQFLCSLKLAVLVILGLAIALAGATIIESVYDTATAQYWIYRSSWFYALLTSLGINIFCVAASRWPWKKRHIPFLLAHAGILILLLGSWITVRVGIDGQLRISEGEVASIAELDQAFLYVIDKDKIYSHPIEWIPPHSKFKSFELEKKGIPFPVRVDQFLSHADPIISFLPAPNVTLPLDKKMSPAIHFQIQGGPMRITQDYWLWEGAPAWREIQAGPAHFSLGAANSIDNKGPAIEFQRTKDSGISYVAYSSDGKKLAGKITWPLKWNVKTPQGPYVIDPGWKGQVKITVLEWIPNAIVSTTYKPSQIQYGNSAPLSAIHLAGAMPEEGVWLGLGDRAIVPIGDKFVEMAYLPRRVMLPFSLRLDRFRVEHDQGTLNPAAYASQVTVIDGNGESPAVISMNEPLEKHRFTIYQSSYEDGNPRPTTSIFSVNQDPGRSWKYSGSLLIVLGSILLFAEKYHRKKY